MLPAQTRAGFGNEQFEDDPSKPQEELDWPEVSFPTAKERGVGFRAGERLEYRAQWGFFRKAGKIVIETKEVNSKIQVSTATASAGLIRRIYPMTLNATSTIDPRQWRMEKNEVNGKTRSKLNQTNTHIDYETDQIVFENKVEPERSKISDLPYDVPLDYASSLLQLRGYDLKVGQAYPIFVTSKGKFYYIEMSVAEIESRKTDLGQRDCFRLEPTKAFPRSKLFKEGGNMSIWITNDDQRIPVRFDVKTSVGTASIRLEKYEAGE